ncbi:MAG: hypothetical protein GX330_04050 [Bacteroidales bacterium]|nr:hypothetical protein [Bacteroidales bacterium]
MKTIVLIRHAKTNVAPRDQDRQLVTVGIQRTQKLGEYLKQMSIKPDIMYSSSALRAVETAGFIASHVGQNPDEIHYTKNLYLTHEEEYFKILTALDNSINTVLFVGHNPEVTDVVRFFIPDYKGYMRTSECYCIDIHSDTWEHMFTAKKEIRFSRLFK